MLEDAKESYRKTGKFTFNTPASYKDEHSYLREVDSMALCNSQTNQRVAFTRYFEDKKDDKKTRKNKFPKYKSKKTARRSYTTNRISRGDTVRIENGKLRLPKVGFVEVVFHRRVEGKIKSVTVSQNASGHYYVSILVELPDLPQQQIDPNNVVGIDMSFSEIAVYSDGVRLKHPRWFRKEEKALARAQRRLHKRQFGSNGYEKQRIKVAKIHERIANKRRDYLHKATRHLVDRFDIFVVEDINLVGMAKKGKHRRFGKSVYDMGFGMFRVFLQYKAEAVGKIFIKADRFFPSTQLCSVCGEKNTDLKGNLSIREWTCCNCNTLHDRDVNAAKNLKLYYKNNTDASSGIYAKGDPASTSCVTTSSKSGRGAWKSCETDAQAPSL